MGSGGLKLLEIQLLLKKDVMFFKNPSKNSPYGQCNRPRYTNIEADVNIFVDLLGRGLWSKLLHSFTLLWFLYQM